MCQYSAGYVTIAVCGDVQRTGNPFDCRRQSFVSTEASPSAFASNFNQDTSALDRHLEIITSQISTATETTASSDELRKFGRKAPKAVGKAKSIGAAVIRRISKFRRLILFPKPLSDTTSLLYYSPPALLVYLSLRYSEY